MTVNELLKKMEDYILNQAKEPRFRRLDSLETLDFAEYDARGREVKGLSTKEIEARYPGRYDGIEEIAHIDGSVIGFRVPVKRKHNRDIVHISVDAVRRCYGGPEEGGWWYNEAESVEQHAVVVRYAEDGTPFIDSFEASFLSSLAKEWLEEYEFGTDYQSSVRPRGPDYQLRASFDPKEYWSDYQPYC